MCVCAFGAASPEQLADAHGIQLKAAYGHEFTLAVRATIWPPPVAVFDDSGAIIGTKSAAGVPQQVDSIERFAILGPVGTGTRPWRRWQRFDSSGEYAAFYVFDGMQTWTYTRREPDDPKDYNTASLLPFEQSNLFDINIFDRFLCTDLKGIVEYRDPTGEVSPQIKIQWDTPREVQHVGFAAYSLAGYNPSLRVEHSLGVLQPPRSCIVTRVISLRGDTTPQSEWRVLEMKEHQGFLYPSRGTFHQAPTDYQQEIYYTFEVTDIRSIGESARENWTLDWPPGTVVNDQVQNRNETIPFAEGQLEKIAKRRSDFRERGQPRPGGLPWLLIFNVVGVVLVLCIWWVRRRTSGS